MWFNSGSLEITRTKEITEGYYSFVLFTSNRSQATTVYHLAVMDCNELSYLVGKIWLSLPALCVPHQQRGLY